MAKTTPTPTYPMYPEDAAAVTPSDTADLPQFSVIYVGGSGAVNVTTAQGTAVTFSGLNAGTVLPVRGRRVWATGTTATLLTAVF